MNLFHNKFQIDIEFVFMLNEIEIEFVFILNEIEIEICFRNESEMCAIVYHDPLRMNE